MKIARKKKRRSHDNKENSYDNKEAEEGKEANEGGESENEGNNEEGGDNSGFSLEDLQDIELLQIKSYATLLVMWGFIFEYFATVGEINAIVTKIQFENSKQDEDSEEEGDDEESSYADLEPDYYVSLNADATAVSGATLALYGQTILVNIAIERYRRYLVHSAKRKISVSKSANFELYISAFLEEAAFLFELAGASNIYNIKLNYPYLDDE